MLSAFFLFYRRWNVRPCLSSMMLCYPLLPLSTDRSWMLCCSLLLLGYTSTQTLKNNPSFVVFIPGGTANLTLMCCHDFVVLRDGRQRRFGTDISGGSGQTSAAVQTSAVQDGCRDETGHRRSRTGRDGTGRQRSGTGRNASGSGRMSTVRDVNLNLHVLCPAMKDVSYEGSLVKFIKMQIINCNKLLD